jgi:glycerol kinase
MAGMALGFWTKEEVLAIHKINRKFKSKMNKDEAEKLYEDWSKIVKHIIQSSNL